MPQRFELYIQLRLCLRVAQRQQLYIPLRIYLTVIYLQHQRSELYIQPNASRVLYTFSIIYIMRMCCGAYVTVKNNRRCIYTVAHISQSSTIWVVYTSQRAASVYTRVVYTRRDCGDMWPFGHISLLDIAREKVWHSIGYIAPDTAIVSICTAINTDALCSMAQHKTCAANTFAQGVKRVTVGDCEHSANHGDISLCGLCLLYTLIRRA